MKKLILALFALSVSVFAQTAASYPAIGQPWHQPMVFVPNTATAVTTSDSTVALLYLSNTSSSQTTCSLVDTSTLCGGAACTFWPAVTLAGNTVYTAPMGGVYVKGGVKWSCAAATTVVGWMLGNYPANLTTEVFPALPDPFLNNLIRKVSLSTASINGHPSATFPAR